MKKKLIILIFFITACLFSIWTWILTAPNLVLSSHQFYWTIQTFLWDNLYANRAFISYAYFILIVILFLVYFFLVKKNFFTVKKTFLLTFILFFSPLLFSYNALSYDVFNYLFNAKMVINYHANPHVKVALDYPDDAWVRFMHNTHTSAPYGYGWTMVSLLPFIVFSGKFTLTWYSFRLLNLTLLFLCLYIMMQWQKKIYHHINYQSLSLFFFNPLVLIEVITNFHNDLWMMLPVLLSLYLLYPSKDSPMSKSQFLFSLILFLFSLSIKYASIALLPAWIFLAYLSNENKILGLIKLQASPKINFCTSLIKKYFFDICAFLMFLPLLTFRSQLFHPWYLLWSLVFIPFVGRYTRTLLLIFSFSSMLRYLPYLWENGYHSHTVFTQQLITFVPAIIYLIILTFVHYNKHHAKTTR